MAKTLVLAEKPSVARELARVLGCKQSGEGYLEGEKYIVTWALGHLVELAPPEDYDKAWAKWDMLTLPMLPERMKTVVIPQSGRQFRAVQAQLRRGDVGELVIATDAGREGELVARWILEKAGWKGPARRLWISSQTDKAIREGFTHLRPAAEYDNLFRSARARSEADWLVGLNVTRALTCKYNAQLSAGRVQTPTLALIVEREEAIRRFVPQEFWTVTAKLPGFTATWRDPNGQARLFDRERAEALAARLAGKEGMVTRLKRTRRQAPPPAAYDLTELQRDANKKYAYSAKETLAILQNLYEIHKVVTYPRTDSRYIPDDVVPTLPERLRSVMVEDYKPLAAELLRSRPLQTKYLVNAAKVTDHHALLPTEEPVELWRLTGPERNIYDLIVRRFLAVLLPVISLWSSFFYAGQAVGNWILFLPCVFSVFVFVVSLLMSAYLFPLAASGMPLGQAVRQSFALGFARPGQALMCALLNDCLAALAIGFLPFSIPYFLLGGLMFPCVAGQVIVRPVLDQFCPDLEGEEEEEF